MKKSTVELSEGHPRVNRQLRYNLLRKGSEIHLVKLPEFKLSTFKKTTVSIGATGTIIEETRMESKVTRKKSQKHGHGYRASATGITSELSVQIDLIRCGWEVFAAVAPVTTCDLLAMKGGLILRFEVKTAYETKNSYRHGGYQPTHSDILALVFHDRIEYLKDKYPWDPIEDIDGMTLLEFDSIEDWEVKGQATSQSKKKVLTIRKGFD